MYYLSCIVQSIEILQCVGKSNPIEACLFHNALSFVAKITKNHEK